MMRLVIVALALATVALASYPVATTGRIPLSSGPNVNDLHINSNIMVVKALKVVASRISRGRQGSEQGFKLLKGFLQRRVNKIESKIAAFHVNTQQYDAAITSLVDFQHTAAANLLDIEKNLQALAAGIKERYASPAVLQDATACLRKSEHTLSGHSFLETDAIPVDPTDPEEVKLTHAENTAAMTAEAAKRNREKAEQAAVEAKQLELQSEIKRMEATSQKLKHIETSLANKAKHAKNLEAVARDSKKKVEDAITSHEDIKKILEELVTKTEKINDEKVKLYDTQLELVNHVSTVLKLGLDLNQYMKATHTPSFSNAHKEAKAARAAVKKNTKAYEHHMAQHEEDKAKAAAATTAEEKAHHLNNAADSLKKAHKAAKNIKKHSKKAQEH